MSTEVTAVLIKTDGTVEDLTLVGSDHERLARLQRVVGGYVDVFAIGHGLAMYFNEEGSINRLEANKCASGVVERLSEQRLRATLVGPVVIVGYASGGAERDVPSNMRERIRSIASEWT